MKNLTFIKARKNKLNQTKTYLARLTSELKKISCSSKIIHSKSSKKIPAWLRVLLFNRKLLKKKRKNDLYFSFEQISSADIYRANNGVYKTLLAVEHKSCLNPLHKIKLNLEKKCLENASLVIASSNMVKNDIIKTYSTEEEKIKVLYNGIILGDSKYNFSFSRLNKEFHINENDHIVLFVGNSFKKNGVKEFLEIFSKLEDKNTKAFVVGKEKKLSLYEKIAKKLNIANRVYFTGQRQDVRDFHVVCDIFLFPTAYEPFGDIILEAMNCKSVVITTKNCGASEILSHKDLLMNASDDFSIITKIDKLLANPLELQKIKEENFEISKKYSMKQNAAETFKLISPFLSDDW